MARYRWKLRLFLLSFFLLFLTGNLFSQEIPNPPVISEIGAKQVISGQTVYTNAGQQGQNPVNLTVKGFAQLNTTIKIYNNGVLLTTSPTTISTNSSGQWTGSVSISTGTIYLTATATNQAGTSLVSERITVILDTTAPYADVYVRQTGWRTNQKYMNGHNNMYGVLTDSASGIDWSTATITVKNLTTGATIAGTTANNGVNQIDFYPSAGWGITQTDKNRYRINVYVRDKAGNEIIIPEPQAQIPTPWAGSGWREYIYDNEYPPAPTIYKIYDPTHNIFSGTGETSSNTPDAEGYVNYFSGMTLNLNPQVTPLKVKGKVVDSNGIPKVNYSNADHHCWYVWESRYYPWSQRISTDSGRINLTTGEFIFDWASSYYYNEGYNWITFYAVDSANLYTGTSIYVKFLFGTPLMPPMPTSPYFSGGEQKVIGSRIIPDTFGKTNKMNNPQTVRLFFAPQSGSYWLGYGYNLSQEVLPEGQAYVNTVGIYDPGDVYSDTNNNNAYNAGEPFLDVVKPATSDGESYSIYNFLNFEYPANSTIYVKIASSNQYGMSEARSLGRFHHRTIPPSVSSVLITPKTASDLSVAQKPTQIVVNVQNSGYDWATSFYGLDQTVSKIEVIDDNSNVVSTNSTSWVYEGSLKYRGTLNVSNVNFLSEKKYTVRVTAKDFMENISVTNSYTFTIDSKEPEVVNLNPAPGALVSTLSNFQATLYDQITGDLNGSGISFGTGDQAIGNNAYTQFKPFKVMGTATASGQILVLQKPLMSHTGADIAIINQKFEVWEENKSVKIDEVTVTSVGSDQVTLTGTLLESGKRYTILYPIPYYHSSNNVDTLSAIPIQPITQQGNYAVQVQAVDKVGNTGILTSSYEFGSNQHISFTPPSGNFVISASPAECRAGEIVEVTTGIIRTSSGNPVFDGTLVTVSTTYGTITDADQDQFTLGVQVRTTGGIARFHIAATTPGIGTAHAQVGSAQSSPDASVKFIPNYPYGTIVLSADRTSVTADGLSLIEITTSVIKDQYNNIITDTNTAHNQFSVTATGFTVDETDQNPATPEIEVKPGPDGIMRITLRAGTTARSSTLTVSSVSKTGTPPVSTASGTIALTLNPGLPGKPITLSATKTTLIAHKQETTTITTSDPIRDANNNIVANGTLITVSTTRGDITSADADGNSGNGIQRATQDGIITFIISSQNADVGAGTASAIAVQGSAQGSIGLQFVPDVPSGTITLTADPAQIVASGSAVSVITSSVIKDQYNNNAGAGVSVNVSATAGQVRTAGGSWASAISVQTDSQSRIVFELKSSTNIETATVSAASASGSAQGSVDVDFVPGEAAGTISLSPNVSELIAGSTATCVVTATLADAYGHAVADGSLVTVSVSRGTILTTDADGNLANGVQVSSINGQFAFSFNAVGGSVGACVITAVSATGYGNAEGTVSVQFIAGAPEGSFTLTPTPASILADGQSVSRITSSLIHDYYGNTVGAGELITVSADKGEIITADADEITAGIQVAANSEGIIEFDLRSSLQSGTASITAHSVRGNASSTTQTVFYPGLPAGTISLSATPAQLIANSGAVSRIVSGQIKDINGNVVSNGTLITVSSGSGRITTADASGVLSGIQIAVSNGTIEFDLSSQSGTSEKYPLGLFTVSVYGEGDPANRAQGSVDLEFVHDTPYGQITLSAQPSSMVADGSSETVITSMPIRDRFLNPMSAGQLVTVWTSLGGIIEDEADDIVGNQVMTTSSGTVSFTLRAGTQAGTSTIAALSYAGTAQGQITVSFVPGSPAGSIALALSSPELELDGLSSAGVTSSPITDAHGNVVADGMLVTVSITSGSISAVDADANIEGIQVACVSGIISFDITSEGAQLGTAVISVQTVDGSAQGSAQIEFIPGLPSGLLTLNASPAQIIADPQGISPVSGVTTSTAITSELITDVSGNIIADGELFTVYTTRGTITTPDASSQISGKQVQVSSGRISFDLSSKGFSAGIAEIRVSSVNGTASGNLNIPFADTGIINSIKIILDEIRPDNDRYVAWGMTRAVIVDCKDIMGNPATGAQVTLVMTQHESGAFFSAHPSSTGEGSSYLWSGLTGANGRFLVNYTTPVDPQTGDKEDYLDAYSASVDASQVADRRFIVTDHVPPIFRVTQIQSPVAAGSYSSIGIEIIDLYDTHIPDVNAALPGLSVKFRSQPSGHIVSGNFYTYDGTNYTALGQDTPVTLNWAPDGYATVYYRDTTAGEIELWIEDASNPPLATPVVSTKTAISVYAGSAADITITATPDTITADGLSLSSIVSLPITDAFGNIRQGEFATVSATLGKVVALDADGNSANGIQVVSGSDGRIEFELRSVKSVGTSQVSAQLTGGASSSAQVHFIPDVPSGQIVLTSNHTQLPANGTSSFHITGSQIKDVWGNLVAAGEKITVSATRGVITATDTDPSTAGTQVDVSSAGTISFDLITSTQAGVADISAISVRGSASGNLQVDFVPGLPAGQITLYANPPAVVANAPNSSLITSAPVTDGVNIVQDGQLFTVWADRGTVVALDESAQIEGIQVKSNAGVISFVFNPNTSLGMVTLHAQSVLGSAQGSVQVELTGAGAPWGDISLNASPAVLPADGLSVSAITTDTMTDKYGNIVSAGAMFRVTASNGTINGSGLSVLDIASGDNGILSFTVKTSTLAGYATITVQSLASTSAGSVTLNYEPGAPAGLIDLQAVPDTLIAKSGTQSTVSVNNTNPIKDIYNNIVKDGTIITINTSLGKLLDDSNNEVLSVQKATMAGKFSVRLKATNGPGTAVVSASAGSAEGSRQINFVPGNPAGTITLSAVPLSVTADGTSTITITSGQITDQYSTPVAPGTLITVSSNRGTIITADADSNPANGIQVAATSASYIEFILKSSTSAGSARVNAQSVSGSASGFTDVNFTPGVPSGTISLTSLPEELIAKSNLTAQITSSIIRDINNNPVGTGQYVTIATTIGTIITADADANSANGIQVITDSQSRIAFTIKADSNSYVGQAVITAITVAGNAQASPPATLRFKADEPACTIILVPAPSQITADGVSTSQITSSPVLDRFGNVVPQGTLVTVSSSWGDITDDDADPVIYPDKQVVTDSQGIIRFTLKSSTKTGSALITAVSVEGSAIGSTTVTGIAGPVTDLIVVLPGETFDLNAPGMKTGTPSNCTINVAFPVKVYPVDFYGNHAVSSVLQIQLQQLSSYTQCTPSFVQSFDGSTGLVTFNVQDTIAGRNLSIAVHDTGMGSISGSSSMFEILAGTPVKLQILLPGQTAVPGDSGSGRQGTPLLQNAGVQFYVIVNYVDQYYNVVTTVSETVQLTSSASGGSAQMPPNTVLTNGSATLPVTEILKTTTGSMRRLTASLIGKEPPVFVVSDPFDVADTLPPELISFTINNGATYASSQSVTLNISAYDSADGIISMQFRNENQTWEQAAPFEAYSVEKSGYLLSPGLGQKIVYIRLKDDTGNTSGEFSVQILRDTPPEGSAGNDITATEGDTVTLYASATDPDEDDTLTYSWDTNGDGIFGDLTGQNPQIHFADNTSLTAVVKITDSYGLYATDSIDITVLNAQPVLSAIDSRLVAVSGEFTVSDITFTDPGTLDTHTITIDWKDGNVEQIPNAQSPLAVSHTYLTSGIYVVQITVTDNDNASDSKSFTVDVSYTPTASAGGNFEGAYLAYEGDTVLFSAEDSTDQDAGDSLVFDWDFDDEGTFDAAHGISFEKTFENDYTGYITVRVTDSKGFFSIARTSVTILNKDPHIPQIPDFSVKEGEPVTLDNIVITDAGSLDTHSITIDWGDGTVNELGIVPSRRFCASHIYTEKGSYNASVTVTDSDGAIFVRQFSVTAELQVIDLNVSIADNRNVELVFTSVENKSYDILYCDNDSVLTINSKRLWKTAERIEGGLFIDSGDDDGFDNIAGTGDDRVHPALCAQRYYCVIQTQPVAQGQWLASPIKYARSIILYEGRNFVGKCGDEDSLNMTLDPRFLPGGDSISEAASATFYNGAVSKDTFVFSFESYPNMWLDSTGSMIVDNEPIPDGCGLIVTLPPGSGQATVQKCGSINIGQTVDIPIAHNGYTMVTWPYDKEVSLDQSGLLQSGILGGSTSRVADQIYFFNGQTQRYDLAVFYCSSPSVRKWKYMNLTDCTRKLKPGEAFLIKTISLSTFSNWHTVRPYGNTTLLLEE